MADGSGAANVAGAAMKAAEQNAGVHARPGTATPSSGSPTWTPTASTPRSSTARSAASATSTDSQDGRERVATRAFNDALHEFGGRRPEAADRLVPDPDPRHRRRRRRGAARRRRRRQVAAAAGVPARARPARLLRRALRPAVRRSSRRRACRSAATSASTPTLDDLARRDPTPQKGVMVPMTALSTAEAFGMWIMGGVFETLPRPQGRVRRARARLGRVVARTSSTT